MGSMPVLYATPQDTTPPTYVVLGNGNEIILTFDFTLTAPPGGVAGATATLSDSTLGSIVSTNVSSPQVTVNLINNIVAGQELDVYCVVDYASGGTFTSNTDGRSMRLVGYDIGGYSTVPSSNILIGSAAITPPAGILDGGTAYCSPTIGVAGANPGNGVNVSAVPALPAGVFAFGTIFGSGSVTVQILNISGGPVTLPTANYTATVMV